MKILLVANFVPYPPTTGGGIRLYNLLKYLGHHHEVTLVSLSRFSTDREGAAYLKRFCAQVELVPWPVQTKWGRRLRFLQGALRAEPLSYVEHRFEQMIDRIRTLTASGLFDVVDVQRTYMAPYVDAISSACQCHKVLSLHDVPYVQCGRVLSIEHGWMGRLRSFYMNCMFAKRAALKYARRFDKCVVVSDQDGDILRKAGPDLDISVVPNGVDTQSLHPLADMSSSPTLLFVGKMDYPPNVDGAVFFCQKIFPLIKQRVPGVRLLIVGGKPTGAVRALVSDDVTVTGYVESVIPYYEQSLISIVPLRAGSGTRLKILESMALGRPVVSTSLGSEGLKVTAGENVLIADTPPDFADQVVRLLEDDELRQRLIRNGRQIVETMYDWQAIARKLSQIYGEIVDVTRVD